MKDVMLVWAWLTSGGLTSRMRACVVKSKVAKTHISPGYGTYSLGSDHCTAPHISGPTRPTYIENGRAE